ncbi:GntR family transcriptional regulator [Janibacter limosus]|jgi:GntR family transcriptional regulator|uniref:GntR family transcriptional regulator n=2 Tax=Janibacter limosus TaxID=53458 RepID=A0A4P6MZJ1_9MICO|nr:GntR family transcriptional regulator [Janibacter limosus]QBF47575.1 GntR family transcriptional regulator [Janibacter limosus]
MSALQLEVVIDRASPVPLYHQLAEQLTAAIDDGRLQPGDPFENELALAARLTLSRPTVRRAIQEMVDQGLLVRRRGLGTTVANRKVHRKARLTSLFDDLQAEGREPRTEVIEIGMGTDERAAAALDLEPGTEMLTVVRVRSAGDQPLAIMHNWLPPAHSEITREDLQEQGLYALLRKRGVRPVVAQQSIGARMPTAAERRALGLRSGQPVLTMTRMAFDASGAAIEFGDHAYRALDYTIDLMLDER